MHSCFGLDFPQSGRVVRTSRVSLFGQTLLSRSLSSCSIELRSLRIPLLDFVVTRTLATRINYVTLVRSTTNLRSRFARRVSSECDPQIRFHGSASRRSRMSFCSVGLSSSMVLNIVLLSTRCIADTSCQNSERVRLRQNRLIYSGLRSSA
jgi:hypothetical protein